MGLSLAGLIHTAAGIAPYALNQLRTQNAIDDQQDQQLRDNFYKSQANDLQSREEADRERLTDAQITNLTGPKWGAPIATTGPDGSPMLVQQDRNGNLRPATLGGDDPTDPGSPPGIPGVQVTPSAAPTPLSYGMPGGPSLAAAVSPTPAVAPTTATPAAPPSLRANVAGAPTPLRPYVKPAVAPIPYNLTPAGIAADSTRAAAVASAEAPFKKDPNATEPKIDPLSPQGIAADSTKAAKVAEASAAVKAAAPGGTGSVSSQTQQARMLAAVTEARLADRRMTAYENTLLSGQASISPLEQAAGSLTTNLSDTHSVLGALTQAGSELGLNTNDSAYAQYLRDAATIGRAEQMMSPRGGNETMVRANALLSRAGSGAMANTINASRMARQALFGQLGGIAQALTPAQNATLDAGVARIGDGQTAGTPGAHPSSGNINLAAPSPLRVKYDAAVTHLTSQGKTAAQIQALLGPPPEGQ